MKPKSWVGKSLIAIAFILLCAAWNVRPAFNHPTGIIISPTASKPVPSYFTEGKPTGSVYGQVLSTLNDKGYSHLAIINESRYPLSINLSATGSSLDLDSTQNLYVASSGSGAWDDISIFRYMYLMSSDGSSVYDGKIKIMVW